MTEKEILQLITRPETDHDRVIRLAAEHNADLPGWCARRKRRWQIVTVAMAATMVTASFFVPQNTDTFVGGDLQCCTDDACQRVDQMIVKI